jgi:hypothetical protein
VPQEEELRDALVLVLANKQDIKGALRPEELQQRLGLGQVAAARRVHMQPCCALTGEGLAEGLEWLHQQLSAPKGAPCPAQHVWLGFLVKESGIPPALAAVTKYWKGLAFGRCPAGITTPHPHPL